MSVLVFAESHNGKFKKSTLEAVCYGKQIASQLGTDCIALADGALDAAELASLGKVGASKVVTVKHDNLKNFDAKAYAYVVTEAANKLNSDVIIFSYNLSGKAVAPRVAAKLNAGLIAGAVGLPDTSNGFVVKKGTHSGKAFAYYNIKTAKKIIGLTPNSFPITSSDATAAVEALDINIPAEQFSVTVKESITASGKIPLTEAELVVSAGRGLKGPENWGMVEEMATILGAATACSRAVADVHWRPHEEHVGQTGLTIRPNLYVAIGISGAIQHLAGVNQSKTIVVINIDKEAPFFKAADYGIIGDAFEVVPKLNEALKKYKASSH
jgi:electron transfer flavoprotein alpha subunit